DARGFIVGDSAESAFACMMISLWEGTRMIVRIYTGQDGQTHFEDLPLPAEESHNVAVQAGANLVFRCFLRTIRAIGTPRPGGNTFLFSRGRWKSGSAMARRGVWTGGCRPR